MRRPRILVISFSPLATDPRVGRQLDLLAPNNDVVAAGFSPPKRADVTYVSLPGARRRLPHRIWSAVLLLIRRYKSYYWRIDSVRAAYDKLSDARFDLILANDADTWPLARVFASESGARLLFDAHEYAPRESEDRLWWRVFYRRYRTSLCENSLPYADGVLTVCDGIADEYARVFGIRRPVVVMNTPPSQPLAPTATLIDQVRMVHHGGATRSRQIETMIQMLDHLDARFTLDLILVPSDPAYLAELQALARGRPRVRFLKPVPMLEIPATLNRYDLGLYLLEPNSFNNHHALPNKFFEFVQARLAVAIGPSPEMAHLVREHGLGIVADDFSPQSLATALNALTPGQIDAFKAAAHRAAPLLSWEHERQTLGKEVQRLLNAPLLPS
jgi:hypothetical protein